MFKYRKKFEAIQIIGTLVIVRRKKIEAPKKEIRKALVIKEKIRRTKKEKKLNIPKISWQYYNKNCIKK